MAPVRRADAGTLLERALVADAARHGLAATVLDWRSHSWASATFVGMRHAAILTAEGDAAAWLAALPESEIALHGALVADVAARRGTDGAVLVEALTIDSP